MSSNDMNDRWVPRSSTLLRRQRAAAATEAERIAAKRAVIEKYNDEQRQPEAYRSPLRSPRFC